MDLQVEFHLDSVYLISSSRKGEEGTTRRLVDDLAAVCSANGALDFFHTTLPSKEGLLDFCRDLSRTIDSGSKPIIHFDMHGSADDGLEIGATGELVDWLTLIECLRPINVKLCNGLFVVMTACHALNIIRHIDIKKPTPFLCLLAPEGEVQIGNIEDTVSRFYNKLFTQGSMTLACEEVKGIFTYFHSVDFLYRIMHGYALENSGRTGKKIKEDQLSSVVSAMNRIPTPEDLKKLRRQIKELSSPAVIFDQYVETFLMSESYGIEI